MARFGCFFEGELTRQERACLTSFVRHGHEVTLFSYAHHDLPAGVVAAHAGDILPIERLYAPIDGPHAKTFCQFSDLFRYVMIRETGLVWIDTDIVCLRADWPQSEWCLARQDVCLVNGAVLGMPRDHPALATAISVAERVGDIAVWGLVGPHLLTALSWEFDYNSHILPPDSFYPLHYSRAKQLLQPIGENERFEIPAGAYCIHLWNEVLRMSGHDRRVGPPLGSALHSLLAYAEDGAGNHAA